jgi:putative ABC transport system permease protein
MFTTYLKIAYRPLRRYKSYTVINIIGLAVGIACCITIMLYIQDELSYDKFNASADRIYRTVIHGSISNKEVNDALSPTPMGPALLRDLPEVSAYTRLKRFTTPVVRYGAKTFNENNFYWADSSFFDVFTVKFIAGDPATALTQPSTVVITESTARRYFGNEDAMGKILNVDHERNYAVTGVVKNFPRSSHFHFDLLGSLSTYEDSRSPFWLSCHFCTYILLREGTDPAEFQKELSSEFTRYASPQLKQSMGVTLDQFEAAGNKFGFLLQPLTSIHLYSHLDHELEPNGDISYVYVFSAIAAAVLLIACINFINLTTALWEKRAKEVGIRKTLGSKRSRLVTQFILESILLSLLAVVPAAGFIELLLPTFNELAGKELSLNLLGGFPAIPALICFAALVGFVAGSYPAFYLSSLEPVQAFKNEKKQGGRRALLRRGLVIFQFVVSIVLFIGALVIRDQMRYVQNKNLGFSKEQVVVINKTDNLGNRIGPFKQELLGDSKVISACNSSTILGNLQDESVFWVGGASGQQPQGMWEMWTDEDFVKTYRMELAEGRFFSKDHPSDTSAVVVNQTAEKVLGVQNLVGMNLVTPGRSAGSAISMEVVGVIKDFHFESLHQTIQPVVIHLLPRGTAGRFLCVRVTPGDYQKTIGFLEKSWEQYAGNRAFDYSFLDQNLAHLYASDQRTSKIVTAFSLLAVLIACLGLLGLVAFVIERRTKEIGIRKVLGASVSGIVGLLTKEFVVLVVTANIIAWPAAYFILNRWLQNFAYRISLNLWDFLLAGVLALIIAFLTLSYQAIKAATANSVEALRYE